MKMTITTTYEIKYSVEYFRATEGGMDHEQFGDCVDSLPEALALLDVATSTRKDDGWVITLNVQKITKA